MNFRLSPTDFQHALLITNVPSTAAKIPPFQSRNPASVLKTGMSELDDGSTTTNLRKDPDADMVALDEILPRLQQRPNSARHAFLVEAMKRKLPPRPLLIQKTESETLDLCGKGIGNDLAAALACSLSLMTHCIELNLKDNNLSDRGIMCIVDAG